MMGPGFVCSGDLTCF